MSGLRIPRRVVLSVLPPSKIVALIAIASVLVWLGLPGSASATAGQQNSSVVQIDGVAGYGGVIGLTRTIPLRLELTSERSLEIVLEIEGPVQQTELIELNAGAPTVFDTAVLFTLGDLSITATADGDVVGQTVVRLPDVPADVVGVAPSVDIPDADRVVKVAGGASSVTLVPIDMESWSRPAYLGGLTQMVLRPPDIDGLSDEHVRALKMWVELGGTLNVDSALSGTTPLFGDSNTGGSRHAYGSGWVRFTGGSAQQNLAAALEPAAASIYQGNGSNEWYTDDYRLTEADYLSAWWIALFVFVPSVIGIPLLWGFLVVRKSNRSKMWFLAPILPVLAALIVTGVGARVLDASEFLTESIIASTPYGSSGIVAAGVSSDSTSDLESNAQLVGTSGKFVARSDNGKTTLDPQSSSGSEVVVLSTDEIESIPIEIEAITVTDTDVEVTVTNNLDAPIVQGAVAIGGQTKRVEIQPGEAVTVEFDPTILGQFAEGSPEYRCLPLSCNVSASDQPPLIGGWGKRQRGLAHFTAITRITPALGDLSHRGLAEIHMTTPIRLGDFSSRNAVNTSMSVESLVAQAFNDFGEQIGGQDGRSALRITPGADMAAGSCSIQSAAAEVEVLTDSGWSELTLSEPRNPKRILDDSNVRDFNMPAMAANEGTYLRFTSPLLTSDPTNLIDCGDRR